MAFDFHIQESISPETGEVTLGDVDLLDPDTGEILQTIGQLVFYSDYRVCTRCGLAVPKDDATYCESDCEYYCPDCCDEYLERCEDCGDWYLREEMVEVSAGYYSSRKWVCESCAEEYGTRCDYCGEWHEYDELIHCVDTDNYYCRNNRRCNDDIYYCADCGDAYEYSNSLNWNDYDEEFYCDNCYERHERSSSVGSYHSHSYYDFRCLDGEKRSSVPFIGFELETYADDRYNEDDVADYTESEFGSYFAMEQDCSIDDGIEFITQPCSINYHLSMLPKIADWTRYLIRHDYDSRISRCWGAMPSPTKHIVQPPALPIMALDSTLYRLGATLSERTSNS